ncbi:2'-5' RNA ligase family protein [Flavobacterium aquariorum]|uniref:2'-5' RNA ligase family protein n=1 Tax=Flavobacterium aquariorum TaxID=2217670 RepID=A0A2W7TXC4_9FLAO|nr:2'-5' RNA ligase family protein [Flavobacterium aquariorum]PZX94698.1 2'-5' RNA ligase family protein [Flavobacterium aquariorum]
MEKLYSLVIHPPESVLTLVKSMKEQLASEVGWFNSKNSVGHITICEFKATEKGIENIKKQINKVCDTLSPVEVHLNEFNSFPNGAFFIAPDNDSKKKLKHIMKLFHKSLLIPNMLKSDNPHLSIARRLKPENLTKANRLFTEIDLNFVCDGVVLRQFDENVKQFFVTDTFKFNNNPQSEMIQETLF